MLAVVIGNLQYFLLGLGFIVDGLIFIYKGLITPSKKKQEEPFPNISA
jgi:hypothetical protein